MNQFESLYIVWTIEPDYAKEYFYKIYGEWEGFIKRLNPTHEQQAKAKEIINEQDTNREEMVQGDMGKPDRDLRSLQTSLSFD